LAPIAGEASQLLAFFFCILPLVSLAGAAPVTSATATYDFDSAWRLLRGDAMGAQATTFDDSSWQPVTLPRAWNENDAFRVGIHDLPTGIAWYRKRFTLPVGAADQKIFLEFQGVRHAAEVYVNGQFVGRHENGVMAFGLDITSCVQPPPA